MTAQESEFTFDSKKGMTDFVVINVRVKLLQKFIKRL